VSARFWMVFELVYGILSVLLGFAHVMTRVVGVPVLDYAVQVLAISLSFNFG